MLDLLYKFFNGLFLFVDRVVYWAVNTMYQLFMMISETGIFTPEDIKTFGSRIYVLLGVFMLFKVSFSFINYIINPDTFTDKSKGVSKLLMNFFVVLIGIVAVPYIFQAAYSLQAIVLKENVIGSLVMGMNAEVINNSNYDYVEQGGKLMSFTTLSAFIRLNPEVVGEECAANPIVAATEEIDGKKVPVFIEKNGSRVRKVELNSACTNSESARLAMQTTTSKGIKVEDLLINAYSNYDTSYFFGTNITDLTVEVGKEQLFIFDYSFIISTIAGGFLAWILLIFCMDIATRSVKFGFLQLIAPIPIISYIDPKSGKDGIFQKWLKECTGTYVSLFVRLLAIYFALFIVTLIIEGGMVNVATGKVQTNSFVKVFIMFGALMFAKELPKLISDITGVKLDGGFTLSPIKKLQEAPLAGWAMTQLGARTAGAIESAIHDKTGNKGRAALAGWFGAGDAIHGKVPLSGAKAGGQAVRGIHLGRQAGYKIATGSEMKTHMPFSGFFKKSGKDLVENQYKKAKEPLQQKLNDLSLQKQAISDAYSKLNKAHDDATDPTVKATIKNKMAEAQAAYKKLTQQEAKINKDIALIDSQIKDITSAYDIDESPKEKLVNAMGHVKKGADGKYTIKDGAYGPEFEMPDLGIPASEVPSEPAVGGVKVSTPNKNGERKTEGGIELPSWIDLDK